MRSSSRFRATRGQALVQWAEAIAQDPNNVEAHNNRGMYYFHEGDYDSAIEDFSRVMKLDPSYGDAWRFLKVDPLSRPKYCKNK